MQCMSSLCDELSAGSSRVPGTRSAVLTLALDSAVEGVLLHAKFDAGRRVHLERRPCVLDHNVMNVVMGLPAGLDLSVCDADGGCIARQLTVAGQSLEVHLHRSPSSRVSRSLTSSRSRPKRAPEANSLSLWRQVALLHAGQSYVVVCDVDGVMPDDGAAEAGEALAAAAGSLSLERIALPVLPPPGPQRTVSLEAAEQHIAQVRRPGRGQTHAYARCMRTYSRQSMSTARRSTRCCSRCKTPRGTGRARSPQTRSRPLATSTTLCCRPRAYRRPETPRRRRRC